MLKSFDPSPKFIIDAKPILLIEPFVLIRKPLLKVTLPVNVTFLLLPVLVLLAVAAFVEKITGQSKTTLLN